MSLTLGEIVEEINKTLNYKSQKEENVSFNYILKILTSYFPINKINIQKKSNKFHLYVCSTLVATFFLTRKHINNDFTHIGINIELLHNGVKECDSNTEIIERFQKDWSDRKNKISLETKSFIDMLKEKFNLDLYDFNILIRKYESLDFLAREYLKSDALLESIELYEKDENAEF